MNRDKRLEELEIKRKQISAKIQAIKAREQAQDRKHDTRRKILIGSMVLTMMKRGELSKPQVIHWLDTHLKNDRDRKLFGLLTDKTLEQSTAVNKPESGV